MVQQPPVRYAHLGGFFNACWFNFFRYSQVIELQGSQISYLPDVFKFYLTTFPISFNLKLLPRQSHFASYSFFCELQ
jgi:hypothetical protein